MKELGYCLFAFIYSIYKLLPIKHKKVLCIMTHDDGEGSNVNIVVKAFQKESREYTFAYIKKSDRKGNKGVLYKLWNAFLFLFKRTYDMASAEIILMDNAFLPFAYLKKRKQQKVVQLWHGTGTIKKFGQDYNRGRLKELEKRANKNITHLIVNSSKMKELYAKAFGVEIDKVYAIGVPKTDELLKRVIRTEDLGRNKDREYIFNKYKLPKDCKLILYAPTFRDEEIDSPQINKWVNSIIEHLSVNYYLGLRLHPFVAEAFRQDRLSERVIEMSFEDDINTLVMAADILVTDYSSIIFDYCVTDKPMVFYPYDLDEFSKNGRGFYNDYYKYVPGPIGFTGEEVAELINKNHYNRNQIIDFKNSHYEYLDGEATKRLIALLNSNPSLKPY